MFKHVQSYLSSNYHIVKNDDDKFVIHSTSDLIYWSTLLSELSVIFSIDKRLIKKFVSKWASVDLNYYFELSPPFFPNVTNVVGSLLGNELQNITPINNPMDELLNLYLQYSASTQHQDQINQIVENNERNIRLFGN
jgi:hypothetical protein